MPNSADLFRIGGDGHEMPGHMGWSLAVSRNHSRAVKALVMVSWVVNVLEAIMNRVVSGSSCLQGFRDVGPVHVGDKMDRQPVWHRASGPR